MINIEKNKPTFTLTIIFSLLLTAGWLPAACLLQIGVVFFSLTGSFFDANYSDPFGELTPYFTVIYSSVAAALVFWPLRRLKRMLLWGGVICESALTLTRISLALFPPPSAINIVFILLSAFLSALSMFFPFVIDGPSALTVRQDGPLKSRLARSKSSPRQY